MFILLTTTKRRSEAKSDLLGGSNTEITVK